MRYGLRELVRVPSGGSNPIIRRERRAAVLVKISCVGCTYRSVSAEHDGCMVHILALKAFIGIDSLDSML